jgi:hypothetical protein
MNKTTASFTCTLKHHSLAGCRHHQMQVEQVQDAADCTDILNPLADIDSWVVKPWTLRVILLWSETSENCWGDFLKLHVHDFFVACAGFLLFLLSVKSMYLNPKNSLIFFSRAVFFTTSRVFPTYRCCLWHVHILRSHAITTAVGFFPLLCN